MSGKECNLEKDEEILKINSLTRQVGGLMSSFIKISKSVGL